MSCAYNLIKLLFQLVDALKVALRKSEKQLNGDNGKRCLPECGDHSDRDAIPMGEDARDNLKITGGFCRHI